MTEQLAEFTAKAIQELYGVEFTPVFTRTDESHGDFATNAALQLAAKVGKQPREIAEELAIKLRGFDIVQSAEVAGPGFVNIVFTSQYLVAPLIESTTVLFPPTLTQTTILLEYSCPNAFKELHTGHLYQTLIGDAMGRIYERLGAKVIRTSFGGDVGLHAAKCMWGILQKLDGENPGKLDQVEERSVWISECYVAGSAIYEENEAAKAQIDELNKRIYAMFNDNDHESDFAKIYFTCRQWSYDYFDEFYASIGAVPFDKYYPESITMQPGLELVNSHRPSVFTDSEGAVVLDESKSGLHTRVFITSNGLPTYETKDLGVIKLESEEFPYDKRVIMTGNDQSQYMQVVFAALKLIDEELGVKQRHVANGTVRFGDGQKMSSRLGNVSRAVDVIQGVEAAVGSDDEQKRKDIGLGAVKYSLLKTRVGGDISFDLDQSISTEGNSGPYLQYALVRARAIIRKLSQSEEQTTLTGLNDSELSLVRKLTEYPEVLQAAVEDFSPHHLSVYLYELASSFNRFYEKNRVIGDERESERATMVRKYEKVLSDGLELLGIPTLEEM